MPHAVETLVRWLPEEAAEQALAIARRSGRPLFVHLYAPGCKRCETLDQTTYMDREVADVLNERFLPVLLNARRDNPALRVLNREHAHLFSPVLIVCAPDGRELRRTAGHLSPQAMLLELHIALAMAKMDREERIVRCRLSMAHRMSDTETVRILGISGSLRQKSSNTALVGAAARLAPETVEVSIYRELAELPLFNPDLERDGAPAAVARFRAHLQACDAVLISSPEYAHGVPGALKNALDWIVGSGELVDKPIAVINASGRATHAWTSLTETLTVMSARVIATASITVPLDGRALDADGIVEDAELSTALRSAIDTLVVAASDSRHT